MNQITSEALEFVNEAKEAFIKKDDMFTYRNKDESFIALRTGFREDCVMVYELGDPVGNFVQQLPSRQKVLVDFDEIERYKKLRNKILPKHIEEISEMISNNKNGKNVEYNKGFVTALELVLKALEIDEFFSKNKTECKL